MRQDVTLSTQDSANSNLPPAMMQREVEQSQNIGGVEVEVKSAIGNDSQILAETIAAEIGRDVFAMWFDGEDSFAHQSNTVTINTADAFRLKQIENRFGTTIRAVVNRICGQQTNVVFATRVSKAIVPAATATVSAKAVCDGSEDADDGYALADDPQQCFSFHQPRPVEKKVPANNAGTRYVKSFWFGDENRLSKAGVEQVFSTPGEFSPLMFYGPTGCGKTHLLEAIVNDFRRQLRAKRCLLISSEQFTTQFVGALHGSGGLPSFRQKYRGLDLLAIDDIQFLTSKRATLSEFLQTVDTLARAGQQVIVTSDRPPAELDGLGADLAARLTGGLTCPLMYPGFDGRLQIVRRICKARNFRMPTPVMELICQHMTRDVRRITGAVNRLYAVSRSLKEPVTMSLAEQVLADLLVFSAVGTSLSGIEQAVCEFCGVKPNELKSSSRRKKVSAARMLAMYLSRRHTSSAFSEIGDHFGGRAHSTVIAAEKKVASWVDNGDPISLPNADYPAGDVIARIESILRVG